MTLGAVLLAIARWLGLGAVAPLDLLSASIALIAALATLAAVVVAVIATRAARRDVQVANDRLERFQRERDAADEQRRADQHAMELATSGRAIASQVGVGTQWIETNPASPYWTFVWSIRSPDLVTITEAVTLPPCVKTEHDTSGVSLLEHAAGPPPYTASGGKPLDGVAQAYVMGEHNINEPPMVRLVFRDSEDNDWLLGPDRALTLLNPRTIRGVVGKAPKAP